MNKFRHRNCEMWMCSILTIFPLEFLYSHRNRAIFSGGNEIGQIQEDSSYAYIHAYSTYIQAHLFVDIARVQYIKKIF